MISIENLMQVANQIETERGVPKEVLFTAIEQALVSACKRKLSEEAEIESELNLTTGEAKIFQTKTAVKVVEEEDLEMDLQEAKKLNAKAKEGDRIRFEITPPEFGRIAAQTAKQVIIQRLREAEKESIHEEFSDKIGTIITGTVQRIENRNYLINLGRCESILSFREQIRDESFDVKDKIKIYVVDIEKTNRGNQILISRSHPGLLKCLFELEIPEIQDGIIDVMSVSREAGIRSKVAVKSNNESIGAVGTCVGQMGGRIQSIIKELNGEKIDVLEWNEDPRAFIANALKPAKIAQVIIKNEAEKEAIVVVPNDQLSLAIGKSGINVRLSARLTGWKLDIMNEDDFDKNAEEITGQAQLSIAEKIKLAKAEEKEEVDIEENSLAKAISQEINDSLSASEPVLTKVSDLAKLLDMKTQELIDFAEKEGVTIKSNRSKLTPEEVQIIKEKIS